MGLRAWEATSDPRIPKQYRWRVRQRWVILEYAEASSLKAAARRFDVDRKTVRLWRQRWQVHGVLGLVPRYPARRKRRVPAEVVELIGYARRELRYGAKRTCIWLARVHRIRAAQATVSRIFHDLGMPKLKRPRRRRPRQLKLFEQRRPGDCVQVDVKFVRVGGRRCFQYTALDDCTRYRVLRLYRRLGHWSSMEFFQELRQTFPFPIRKLQCDNGKEFPFAFALSVREAGIEHRYIRPRRPQQNGKVERSHRIDSEEFWGRSRFRTFAEATTALSEWERVYNHERFSLAIGGRTPAEKLADVLEAA